MRRRNDEAKLRSESLWLAAYFLSRRTQPDGSPPGSLQESTWKAAYERFHPVCGDGRSLEQFGNTLKNARDMFDGHLSASRVGWRSEDEEPANLSAVPRAILSAWRERSDAELDLAALDLLLVVEAKGLYSPAWRDRAAEETRLTSGAVLSEKSMIRAEPGVLGLRRSVESKLVGDLAEAMVRTHLERTLADPERQTLVHHAAIGETPGFDISYQRNGKTCAIEVKRTVQGSMNGFEMTANEWNAAERLGDMYELYLVSMVKSAHPKYEIIRNPICVEQSGCLSRTASSWAIVKPTHA